MYLLYVWVGNKSGYDVCYNEGQLMEDMVDIANKYHTYNFDIWELLDNQRYHYRRIYNKEDFEQVLNEYNMTKDIPDMSCLELKDYITKRALKRTK